MQTTATPAQPHHAKHRNSAITQQKPVKQPEAEASFGESVAASIGVFLVFLLVAFVIYKWARWWWACLRAATGYRKVEVIHKWEDGSPYTADQRHPRGGFLG